MQKVQGPSNYIFLITGITALGGLLFGYDTAIIAGAIGFLKIKFELTPALTGWAASSAILGAIVGALGAGAISDRIGRKKALMMSALFFAISGIGTALPRNLTELIIFRVVGGVGFGMASLVCPLYITEIAPAKIRGALVSLNQLAIVTGILMVYFVNAKIATLGNDLWNVSVGWRYMFASEFFPALLFLILLLIVPESPRWLIKQGRDTEALKILTAIGGPLAAQGELSAVKGSLDEGHSSTRELFKPAMRWTLMIGVVLAILSQITGINAIMYYAPEIFKNTGMNSGSAMMQTVTVGVVNLAFTFVAIWLVDRLGRKMLLLAGASGMALSLAAVGYGFYTANFASPLILISILLYIACFSASLGPVSWVVMAEIFPTHIRGRAMSIATFALWVACYLVSQSFPMLLAGVGIAQTFWLYMVFAIITVIFVFKVVPETKGRSLEDIQRSLS